MARGANASSEAGSDSSSDEIDTTAPASTPARAAPTNHEDANPMKVLATTIAKEFLCPITQELPIKPVTAEDGKIYEEAAIREWFARNDGDQAISPSTNTPMGKKLLPAPQARNTIEALVNSGAIDDELATAWKQKLADETLVKEERAKAEDGNGNAMWRLGVWYGCGKKGLAKDDVQARAWYERSAAARHPKGMALFGCCLLKGVGGPEETSLGLVNVTEAAGLGSDFAACNLGELFFHGNFGLPKDPVRARFWLKKIADGECAHKHLNDAGLAGAAELLRELDEQANELEE